MSCNLNGPAFWVAIYFGEIEPKLERKTIRHEQISHLKPGQQSPYIIQRDSEDPLNLKQSAIITIFIKYIIKELIFSIKSKLGGQSFLRPTTYHCVYTY